MVREAHPATVVEFGLRRAQGPDGALSASRAAYLGGCVGTSNMLAGARFDIPVYGTHAHSWVMAFADEQSAFDAYAEVFPQSTVLLIDTYDTLEQGLQHAIATARRMQARGERLAAVRLDSGDLAYLSKACRRRLNEAGFAGVKILVSSDVDEYVIRDLKAQGCPIDIFGVGTRLATAFQEPALNGVYKLCALRHGDVWEPKLKLSSNPAKSTIPGRKQLWRWEHDGAYLGDCLTLVEEPPPVRMIHPEFAHQRTELSATELRPLLEARILQGRRLDDADSLTAARDRAQRELDKLPQEHRRLINPHVYRVGLSQELWDLRRELMERWSSPPSPLQ
jgi:nicotinate phosphoribosyltransferase